VQVHRQKPELKPAGDQPLIGDTFASRLLDVTRLLNVCTCCHWVQNACSVPRCWVRLSVHSVPLVLGRAFNRKIFINRLIEQVVD